MNHYKPTKQTIQMKTKPTIRLKKTGLEVTSATIQDRGDGGTGSGDATKQ